MGTSQKARILVVDDEPDLTLVIKHGLENDGYLVDVFNDAEQALYHFKPDYYHTLILDIRMPKMTGFQLYGEIRKIDSKTPVCFMTAFDAYNEEFDKMSPSHNVKCFIKKPVRVKDLLAMIRDQLDSGET
jgi:DNA-binding response OmpR family regulator